MTGSDGQARSAAAQEELLEHRLSPQARDRATSLLPASDPSLREDRANARALPVLHNRKINKQQATELHLQPVQYWDRCISCLGLAASTVSEVLRLPGVAIPRATNCGRQVCSVVQHAEKDGRGRVHGSQSRSMDWLSPPPFPGAVSHLGFFDAAAPWFAHALSSGADITWDSVSRGSPVRWRSIRYRVVALYASSRADISR